MNISVTSRPLVIAAVLVGISMFCCNIGRAHDEDTPQTGVGGYGYEPYTGGGVVGNEPYTGVGSIGGGSQTGAGVIGDDPAEIVAKALLCFNQKQIYSGCVESYRLTQSGYLNVPPDYVDEYCSGPCFSETNLVLNCIENIMAHFKFFNKATTNDIRNTIKAGCSYGPERGDFNVAKHLQSEKDSAYKTRIQILVGLGFAIMVHALLL